MPNAPTPAYDRDGNLALGWLVVCRYDPVEQVVTISWSKDGDLYRQSKRGAVALEEGDRAGVEDALIRTTAMLTNPSLL